MRRLLARIVAVAPADTWFFLSVSVFGAVLTVVYWFWTYDWAGTVLLFGFAVATGLNGLRLLLVRPPRRMPEERVAADGKLGGPAESEGETLPAGAGAIIKTPLPGERADAVARESITPPTPDSDRPFLDETGRLPEPTIAPFAIALAVAFIATSLILGPWLLVAAVLPLAWGAIGWIRDAGAEYRATDQADAPSADGPSAHDAPASPTSREQATSGGRATSVGPGTG